MKRTRPIRHLCTPPVRCWTVQSIQNLVMCMGFFLWHAAATAQNTPNLIYNGDMEIISSEQPPSGWTMWGAEAFKIPGNYTRDTISPHGGDACFQMVHPANTRGYIVSSPAHAIQPKTGMTYTISFWARSSREGSSSFGLTAYEAIAPFKDAPSPGRWPIEVDTTWRQFSFDTHEGWDFFADRSRYLLLTFYPTRDDNEECILWIDDVVVTEMPCPRKGRLLDTTRLTLPPLRHRLSPGDQMEIAIDAEQRLGKTTREVGAVSFHRVAGWTGHPFNKEGVYTLPPETEQAIRELHMPMTRFYAVGEEPFGLEASLDRVADVCNRVNVPQDHCVLELETQGATDKLSPEVWSQAVAYSRERGYAFRYWEVSNEPYLMKPGTAFPTPDAYIDHITAVSKAIRAVDPDAQIGVGIHRDSQKWGNYILKRAAGTYDFVAAHHYAHVRSIHKCTFEEVALEANYEALTTCLRVNALMKAYNPGRHVYQYDTEWGMHAAGPNGERADYVDRNANIFGTLHRAVRLIYYAREGMLTGASAWQMLNSVRAQGFGVLAPKAPDKRFMLYWLYYYFNRHLGEWNLDIQGTVPYRTWSSNKTLDGTNVEGPIAPVLATLSSDEQTLYIVIANGSWDTEIPCHFRIANFPIAAGKAALLSHPDPDGRPLLEKKEEAITPYSLDCPGTGDIRFTSPGHSVLFITLTR